MNIQVDGDKILLIFTLGIFFGRTVSWAVIELFKFLVRRTK